MAPVTLNGHKVYGAFIAPGMGLRQNDAKGTAVDDQAEGQYWVINGHHYNGGCCFDYGNGETDSRDDGDGTMETTYYGAAVSATFRVTAGPAAFNGDIVGRATWTANGMAQSESASEKVRNVSPIQINEFAISAGSPGNATDSFIELYNAGDAAMDLSNWSLTHHASMLPIFSSIKVPAGTTLPAKGFYVFGLATSGLAVPAKKGDTTLYVRSVAGLKVGDAIEIGTGSNKETRRIATLGTAAGNPTTVWQPLPDGPVLGGNGAIILRNAAELVVDSLNYGELADPWAAEGYRGTSPGRGCFAASPGTGGGFGGGGGRGGAAAGATSRSSGRFPDGADTDSNCNDFMVQTASSLAADSAAVANNIKVSRVSDFSVGQIIIIDSGANRETAAIATVGTAGGTTVRTTTEVGATVIPVANAMGFSAGQTITIDSGANQAAAVVASISGGRGPFGGFGGRPGGPGNATITVAAPLKMAHAMGAQVSDSGISLTPALTKAHASGAQVAGSVPTPGAPNQYSRKPQ